MTLYRTELGIANEIVVMYAGNVGYSQSLDMVLDVARSMPSVMFVINGDGSARAHLESSAKGCTNVKFVGYQPLERLSEVLATGDIHLVPLRSGLARVSVPSKTYSIMAASRPVLASIDPDTEIPRLIERAGAGVCVGPDDTDALRSDSRDSSSPPNSAQHSETVGERGWSGMRHQRPLRLPTRVCSPPTGSL